MPGFWRKIHLLRWQCAVAGFLSIALTGAYLLWRDAPLPGAIEGQMLSWRFQSRGPLSPPGEVVILAVDDATMAAGKRWPVPRQMLAEAVERLQAAGVRAVGLDLLLLETGSEDEDRALGAALQAVPAVLPARPLVSSPNL